MKVLAIVALGYLTLNVANAALVTLDDTDLFVRQGDTIEFDILGEGFTDGPLDGWGIDLAFDGTLVSPQATLVDDTFWDLQIKEGDLAAGRIDAIAGLAISSRTGNFVLATVQLFAENKAGVTPINISEWVGNPFATGGELYPNLTFDNSATVTVLPIPVPPAAWLFMSALGLLGWLRWTN